MTGQPILRLIGAVGDSGQPMIAAAARHLARSLAMAKGEPSPVEPVFVAPDTHPLPDGAAVILSLDNTDGATGDAWPDIAARWRERLGRYSADGRRILLCNLPRHANSGMAHAIGDIRRLDRLAITLSRETGVEIVDIDRLFALCGAATARTDGAALAGHAIAAALLDGPIDPALTPAAQDQAIRALGGWRDVLAHGDAEQEKDPVS